MNGLFLMYFLDNQWGNMFFSSSFFFQGVVLTHSSLIANVAGNSLSVDFGPSDVLVLIIRLFFPFFQIVFFLLFLKNIYIVIILFASDTCPTFLQHTSTRESIKLDWYTTVLLLVSTRGYGIVLHLYFYFNCTCIHLYCAVVLVRVTKQFGLFSSWSGTVWYQTDTHLAEILVLQSYLQFVDNIIICDNWY